MAHLHNVYDSDSHFIIDPITRAIKNESSKKTMIMQHDHNSERFTFSLPRLVEGHDMSACDRVEIHYINTDASNKENKATGIYEVDDLGLSSDDKNTVICSWLLSQNTAIYAGQLSFIIRFVCLADDNTASYVWNTAICSSITVSSGILNSGEEIVEPYVDVLAQWKADLFGVGDTQEQKLLNTSAEQQAAITAEGEKQIAAVAGKGAAVLDSIPETYADVSALADNNYRNKADIIELDAEGKSIVLNDSSDCPLKNFKVFGRSEQRKTTGKNLFDPANVVNGYPNKVTGLFEENISNRTAFVLCEPNTTYTASKMLGERFAVSYTTEFPANGVAIYGVLSDYDAESLTITTGSNAVYLLVWAYNNNVDLDITDAEMLATLQIEKGDTATEYEPYTGGKPSPNPDFSQVVESLGSAGDVAVNIHNSNILPYPYRDTTKTANGITFTDNGDGSITVNGTATATVMFTLYHDENKPLNDGFYYLTGCPSGGTLETYILRASNITTFSATDFGDGVHSKVEAKYVFIRIFEGVTVENLTFKPMMNTGDAVVPFEKGSLQKIAFSRTLPGIPVETDGNYTDENGQQWISDEIDLNRGVYIQRVKSIELTGQESWQTYSKGNVVHCFRTKINDLWSKTNSYTAYRYSLFSNYFAYGGYISENLETGIGLSEAQYIYLRFDGEKEPISDLESLAAWLASKYESGDSVKVVYPLAEPIETPLSDAEITAFKALNSNKPVTTIMNDSGAYMAVKYAADTKAYIDNKIVEMLKGSD